MTSVATGQRAEAVTAAFLVRKGFRVLSQNWRCRYCEIDIVASRAQTIYFVEVKYRRSSSQGTGLDYITGAKLRRMTFAAELWVTSNSWLGDYILAAAEVAGSDFQLRRVVVLS